MANTHLYRSYPSISWLADVYQQGGRGLSGRRFLYQPWLVGCLVQIVQLNRWRDQL